MFKSLTTHYCVTREERITLELRYPFRDATHFKDKSIQPFL